MSCFCENCIFYIFKYMYNSILKINKNKINAEL